MFLWPLQIPYGHINEVLNRFLLTHITVCSKLSVSLNFLYFITFQRKHIVTTHSFRSALIAPNRHCYAHCSACGGLNRSFWTLVTCNEKGIFAPQTRKEVLSPIARQKFIGFVIDVAAEGTHLEPKNSYLQKLKAIPLDANFVPPGFMQIRLA